MSDLVGRLVLLERRRVEALVAVDTAVFDSLHDDAYQLCNPTGVLWSKSEYRDRLTSGRLVYDQLAVTSEIEVLTADILAVLRYRCLIALRIDGIDIEAHECQHVDMYRLASNGQWRCRYSQATGILDTIPAGT